MASPYIPEFDPAHTTVPTVPGWDEANELASEIMAQGMGLAATGVNFGPGSLIADSGDIDTIEFPDQVTGFGEDNVSFANALAAFEGYLNALPSTTPSIDLDETPTTPPTIDAAPELSTVTIPEFLEVAPVVDYGVEPVFSDPGAPGEPTIEMPSLPFRPSIVYPTEPTLTDIIIPSPVAIEIPIFSALFVDDDLTAPTNTFSFNEVDYSSALKDAVYNSLLTDVQNGDYGLEPNDEILLWNRARDKESANSDELINEVRRSYAITGFSTPPGSMGKALEKAILTANLKNSSMNRELTLKRADLYWDGKKFVHTTSIQLEQLLMNLHNAKWERVLNAAKAQMEILIALFNAQIARYNAKVVKYRVEAEIFESRIRAEIAKVELYKAQMEGARVQSEVQKNQVEIYKAMIEGVKQIIEAYKTDIEASNILLNRERIKTELYRAQVEAYAARLGAEKYKFDAFESKVKGELGKVQAFGEKARAYVAQIEGKKAEVDVNRLKLAQWSEENKANIDIFTMEIGEKKEIRDIQTKVFDSEVTLQRLQYDSFLAKTQGLSKIYDVGQAALERSYRIILATLQQNIENVRVQVQRVIAVLEAQTRLSIVTAEANARLGAAAMGMVNLNTSIGNQFHKQVSQSGSASMNTSTQYALHDSYNTSISRQQLYHYQGRVL